MSETSEKPKKSICLASQSKGRQELLRLANVRYNAVPAHIDESRYEGETAETYVLRLAREKAKSIPNGDTITVGADSVVVFQGEIIGKPTSKQHAFSMLKALQGNTHELISGICVYDPHQEKALDGLVSTSVTFLPLFDTEISEYVDTFWHEIQRLAGAYAFNSISSFFVAEMQGSPSNVQGLPMPTLKDFLNTLGHSWFDFLLEEG